MYIMKDVLEFEVTLERSEYIIFFIKKMMTSARVVGCGKTKLNEI